MSPPAVVRFSQKTEILSSTKEGGVGKLKTEVRTPLSFVKRNQVLALTPARYNKKYTLNKNTQLKKIVHKNKNVAPVSTLYHTNDVVMRYSPAVFKDALIKSTEAMTEGKEFKSDKLDIKVKKTRLTKDSTGNSKVDNLITFEISLQQKPDIKIKQQLHVYYTSQSVMVQGNRLLGGIKAFKLFIEDFLQPLLKIAIDTSKATISETEDILEKVLEQVVKAEDKSKNQEWIDCNKCDGKFKFANDLEKHMTNHVNDINISKRELSTSPGIRSQKKIREDPSSTQDNRDDTNKQLEAKIPTQEELKASQVDVVQEETVTVTAAKEEEMKMEIDEKIEEVKELQKEIVKMKKDHDAKYIEIVEEAKKMSDSLIQIQKERDLYYAKVQVLEKKRKRC